MSYIKEAFDHRHPGWGEENYRRLASEKLPFFCPDVAEELRRIDFDGKDIAQFCCNNGRELLSLMGIGAKSGIGFDIAENIIAQAADTALFYISGEVMRSKYNFMFSSI